MLINVRGTNGSGKTYISHKLILDHQHTELVEPEVVREKRFVKPNCYAIEDDLYVAGRWKSGLDGIFPQEIVEDILRYWAPKKNVIWENVLVSANIGRWAVLAKELEPVNHNVWLYLDTPLEVCIERVQNRRQEARDRGFDHRQEDTDVKLDVIAGHWRRVRRSAARAVKEGIDVRWIDYTRAYEQVYALLINEGNWRPSSFDPYSKHDSPIPWQPTPEELQYVLKTAKLPWEPDDTVTKVAYKSKPKSTEPSDQFLGIKIKRWGGEKPAELQGFGVLVKPWESTIQLAQETL